MIRADMRLPLSLTLSILLTSVAAQAQEWTRFRGPNGTGCSSSAGIPVTWKESDYRWKIELPGVGHSSPVVWKDRVFVTSALPADATQIVQCLKTADGDVVWRREFPSSKMPKNDSNNFASSTPTVDAQRVYVTWASREHYFVVALRQADGQEVWRHDLGPFEGEHGFGCSPILVEGLVIAANEQNGPSCVLALDAETGKVRWQTPRKTDRAAYATPCLYQPPTRPAQLITSSSAHGLSGLDPQTGKSLWELPVFQYRVVGSPLVAGGLIVAAAGVGGGGKQVVAVRPGDPQQSVEPKLAYEVKPPIPYVPAPVAKGDLLFLWGDGGVVSCLDLASGSVHWQERVGRSYFSSPICVADRLYNVSRDGKVVVLAAAKEYQKLGETDLGEGSHATPAVAGNTMYLRTLSHLMAIGGTQ